MEPKLGLKHCAMEPRLRWCLCVALAIAMASTLPQALGQCGRQCDLALVYFNVSRNTTVPYIRSLFDNVTSVADISSYNTMGPPISESYIQAGVRIRIPLPSCSCRRLPDGTLYLGLVFNYTVLQGDTYYALANNVYRGLTTASWLQTANTIPATSLRPGNVLNISINCSCGDPTISKDYGLFMTYPLEREFKDTLANISSTFGVSGDLIRRYNPHVDFNNFSGIAFIPVKDNLGSYRPFGGSGRGFAIGAIIGICIAAVVVLVIIALGFHFHKRKKVKMALLLQPPNTNANVLQGSDSESFPLAGKVDLTVEKSVEFTHEELAFATDNFSLANKIGQANVLQGSDSESFPLAGKVDLTVEKSVEFTHEELAFATDNFSLANKIGQGGFGAVYYGEVRGEKAAIKRMDMEATHEFMAELKVLTHVHHLNLVHLIGFCTEESLFLVYEFIDNGNLSQHLRGSAMQPLSWAARVQIALDSARGLEYIHEHTVPMYIHRDIKSANILIDKNFRAKVADFGLTKLTEVGGQSASLQTRLAGTFGYMPPEYAQFGDVSPKVDVYAFGVVLYEIISAKEAIIRTNETFTESKGLVALFENVWKDSDGHKALEKLIDPRLENYPLESVWKMATLAKACTQENPELRPNMRTVVVALMTLSTSEEWHASSIRENKERFMSGK